MRMEQYRSANGGEFDERVIGSGGGGGGRCLMIKVENEGYCDGFCRSRWTTALSSSAAGHLSCPVWAQDRKNS